jgi:hypothetical protein
MQQRLPKFRREPRALTNRQITERSLAIIETIHRYRILPTSLTVHLVVGDTRTTQQHLQMLFHRGLINRFAFPRIGNPGEFHYYLDNTAALDLLVEQGSDPTEFDYEAVRRNKEKAYAAIHDPAKADEMQGKLLFLKHEAMISRFHATLELACRNSGGEIVLAKWQQGAALWHHVPAPKLSYNGIDIEGRPAWRETDEQEYLPHRPDAFFSLYYSKHAPENQWAHFMYEADRKTTSTTKHNRKLRAHFQFIVRQKMHELTYGIKRIRAVLIETLDDGWADTLRNAAREYPVSGNKPSPLFWFTTSRLLTTPQEAGAGEPAQPNYLAHPEIILQPIWATPADNQLYSLLD